jgi:NhaA family Na+:H+ antiporter
MKKLVKKQRMTKLFKLFFESEKAGGIILIFATLISLIIANSQWGRSYDELLHLKFAGLSLEHWVNDGLMTIFFLLIGLELEREIYVGELSNFRDTLLPFSGALGGMLVPAGIFAWINYGLPTTSGAGIPMATDIAFAIGILSLLGNKVPLSVKVFLTALAVIDDLGAILIIAFFYSTDISIGFLLASLGVFLFLMILSYFKIRKMWPYVVGGIAMWFFMLNSGIHATITGVMLAFVIPFGKGDYRAPSSRMQHFLHKPVTFVILPIFALANTAIHFNGSILDSLGEPLAIGIIAGLVVGKPLGIFVFTWLAVKLKVSSLPNGLNWSSLLGVGMLAGIGFTMSIFITLLAVSDTVMVNNSKMAVLAGSVLSGAVGFSCLYIAFSKKHRSRRQLPEN